LDYPQYSQPLCTILQIALVQLLRDWGISPNSVVGHSSGEIAAAYAIGSISMHSALKIAYYRGVVSQKLRQTRRRKEAMMSVGLSQHDVQKFIREALQDENDYLTIGCVNSPSNVTLSGYRDTIKALHGTMQQAGIFARILNVDTAYHSRFMQTAASEYLELLGEIEPGNEPCERLAIFSSVTGTEVSKKLVAKAEYWVKNMTHQVKFSDAITSMVESQVFRQGKKGRSSVGIVLEIGPHSALRIPIKHTIEAVSGRPQIEYNSMLIKGTSALTTSLNVAGSLFCSGHPVKLAKINEPEESSSARLLTDAPEYQFNHSQTYWRESRLSRNFRFRSLPEHELLGVPIPDWNPLDARWRKVFRLGESNWLLDHKVNGSVLFPAAGMMTMAMEGSRILANSQRTVSAHRISDMHFLKGIILSTDSSGTEVQASFRPISDKTTKESDRWDFQLYVLEAEQWSLCCQGLTGVTYGDAQNDGTENIDLDRTWDRSMKFTATYQASVLYKELSGIGYDYGPTFQVLGDMSLNFEDHEAIAKLLPECSTTRFPNDPSSAYMIHPTTLDGMFQLMLPTLSEDHTSTLRSMLPARVDHLHLVKKSGKHQVEETASSNVHVRSTFRGYRNCVFTVHAKAPQADLFIRGFRMVSSDTTKPPSAQSSRTGLCYKVKWEPDIQLIESNDLEKHCQKGDSPFVDTDNTIFQDLGSIVASYIAEGAASGPSQSKSGAEAHLQKYIAWMQSVLGDQERQSGRDSFDTACQPIMLNATTLLVQRIGEKLPEILDGSLDPLDLLFSDDLMQDVYVEQLQNRAGGKLVELLSLYSHKNPAMRILEVGAGTGATTRLALEALTKGSAAQRDEPRFASYTFTDISPTFTEAGKEIFRGLEHRAIFRTLDLEYSPIDQGFEAGQYDLVIAAGVLHATRNISRTVGHIRQILKPKGKLILYELTQPASALNTFVWGILTGWWLSEETWRSSSPLLSPDQWNDVLQSNGFSGVDTEWPDHQDPVLRSNSVLVSTASPVVSSTSSQCWNVSLVADATNVSSGVAEDLMRSLSRSDFPKVKIISLQEIELQTIFDGHYIFLHELSGSHLADMTGSFFCGLQLILASAESVFWVTTGSGSRRDPRLEIVTGLARTAQSEACKARFGTLSLEDIESPQRTSKTILKTFSAMIMNEPNEFEQQYEEKNGIVHIPRLTEYSKLSEYISHKTAAQSARSQKLRDDPSRQLVLSIRIAGLLDTLEFTDDRSPPGQLAPDEIEVKVEASGLIFRDVLIAAGIYDDTCFGLEFAGTVIKIGMDVQAMKVGDRICGCSYGTFRTLVRCKAITAVPIPESMPFTTAVAYPVTHCTAYHCLINVAQLQKGEAILIHSAAGGTGQAAVQLAKHIGAEVFATVGSGEKKHFLVSTYGIPEDHIFSSRDTAFKDAVLRLRGGKGVEVILNSVSGELFLASLETIAPFGRFVEIGKKESASIPLAALSKNVVFAVVDLSRMLIDAPSLLGSLMGLVMELVERGVFSVSTPLSLFPASQIEDAFRHMQSGKSMGKIVIAMGDDEVVQVSFKIKLFRRQNTDICRLHRTSDLNAHSTRMPATW
jgi:NADPH:quinone reductase-like Zn-dependent oxidoreductase/acyl transferase domain-containing protein